MNLHAVSSVRYNGEDIDIEIHIIVEYGTRINSVAESVANTVRFHVEKALGLRVNTVNVHVAGLRVSNTGLGAEVSWL